MNFNLRFTGSGVLAIALLSGGAWLWRESATPPQPAPVPPPANGEAKAIPTDGGQLLVATMHVKEPFVKVDPKVIWGVPMGTTKSTIRADVYYRYYIEMKRKWPIDIDGKTATIEAEEIKPTLPVAFDSKTIEKHTENGWARFNKEENLTALEKSITEQLQTRAGSPQYQQTVRDASRVTVKEFVTTWLLKTQGWGKSPQYKVIVLFPGESLAEATAKDGKDQQ